jgi:hypothetical protein
MRKNRNKLAATNRQTPRRAGFGDKIAPKMSTRSSAHPLLSAGNREWDSLAVATYFGYERSSFRVEWAHNVVALAGDDRANFIFQRSDLAGGRVFEVNGDRHN